MSDPQPIEREIEWWEGENQRIDPLPLIHPRGFSLEHSVAICPQCNGRANILTQHADVRGQCIECRQHAACYACGIRFNCHVRFYGTHWMFKGNHGWHTEKFKLPFRVRFAVGLKKAWRKIFLN